MQNTRRTGAIAFFITLGACLVALALALYVGWVILNWREIFPLVLGLIFFAILIAGLVLNTIFLVREVRRNERQDSFLNAVTHELKTPIASIRLYLETLQRRQLDEAQRQEFYRVMLSDSDRLLSTVEQVLKAGELGQRQSDSMRIQIDLVSLAQECIDVLRVRHHLATDAVTLQQENGGVPAVVLGNLEDLRSAVQNVLDNAVKYSAGAPKILVRIGVEHDAWVVVHITDSGIGIPPSHLKRVFRRFYRVPSMAVLRAKGTGLGLFLVRTIARQHGGDATAYSEGEGRGTTITLQLPRLLESHEAEL
ncbi:MAG TPA: HAMP domain-containing sensor histidine kinase [Acidobacteriaceae bacterium]|jgi:signal transduction histidine kinase|nr:HAMP domain-containing sensor histidine kinase [Acidobacteriaceae bacterium]